MKNALRKALLIAFYFITTALSACGNEKSSDTGIDSENKNPNIYIPEKEIKSLGLLDELVESGYGYSPG